MKKILIMGLPGSGKTTLAKELANMLGAIHFNADEIRQNINKDLGFSIEDRIEHARRMGVLCDIVVRSNNFAIADFICPTPETRQAFGLENTFIIFIDRIEQGRFEDTNRIFIVPKKYNIRVTKDGTSIYWANKIRKMLVPNFNPKQKTALLLGRYQPFHVGHKQLIEEAIKRVGQVCIAVRDTEGIDSKNPFNFEEVEQNIRLGMKGNEGLYTISRVSNITNVFYGRDVGYKIEKIELEKEIEDISGTKIREQLV